MKIIDFKTIFEMEREGIKLFTIRLAITWETSYFVARFAIELKVRIIIVGERINEKGEVLD